MIDPGFINYTGNLQIANIALEKQLRYREKAYQLLKDELEELKRRNKDNNIWQETLLQAVKEVVEAADQWVPDHFEVYSLIEVLRQILKDEPTDVDDGQESNH